MAFTGIPRELAEWVHSLGLSPYALIAVLSVVYLVLGTALDGISMIVLTSAVVLPMIQKAGFDPIWFGIFIVLVVEMAADHAARGVQSVRAAGHDRAPAHVDREGVTMPMFFACLIMWPWRLIYRFPRQIVTWLPQKMSA
jgi:TRAP-type C4-dicarboxylate transport system permease large subunit